MRSFDYQPRDYAGMSTYNQDPRSREDPPLYHSTDQGSTQNLPSYNHPPNNESQRQSDYLKDQYHQRQVSTNSAVDTFRLDPQAVQNDRPLISSRVPDYRTGSREQLGMNDKDTEHWKTRTGENFMNR